MSDIELRLDRAIDRLNAGAEAACDRSDDLAELIVIARALRAITAEQWPDHTFPSRLAAALSRELPATAGTPRRLPRRSRGWLKVGLGLATLAAIAAVLAIALERPTPVSAAQLVQRTLVATSGRNLAPVSFTQVITNSITGGAVDAAPPPVRIVERVTFAASHRWRMQATITEPFHEGTARELTVRDGTTIVSVSDSPAEGRTEIRWHAPVGASGLPTASAFGARIDPLDLLAQTRGRCGRSLSTVSSGPTLAGRATEQFELGPSRCPSAAMQALDGPATFVVDRGTNLVLEAVTRTRTGRVSQRVATLAFTSGAPARAGTFRLPKPLRASTPTPFARVSFPEVVPTARVEALRAGSMTPVATRASDGRILAFTVTYTDATGHPALQLYEAAAATPSVRYPGRTVEIRAGVSGTFLNRNGVRILWWTARGVYLSLQEGGEASGVTLAGRLPLRGLVRIAASAR